MLTRRQFLKQSGLLIVGSALGSFNLTSCKQSQSSSTTSPGPDNSLYYLRTQDPANVDNESFPVTQVSALHFYGEPAPVVASESLTLKISGLVNNPMEITLDRFKQFERVTHTTLMICPDGFADNALYSGVLFDTLLKAAEVKPEAKMIRLTSVTGTWRGISIDDAVAKGVYFADQVDGIALPPSHGYPLRVVQPHVKGAEWLKWVNNLEVVNMPTP